jgi:hypothetical protein
MQSLTGILIVNPMGAPIQHHSSHILQSRRNELALQLVRPGREWPIRNIGFRGIQLTQLSQLACQNDNFREF